MGELQQMLVEQLKDAFSAEKQAIQAMRRTLRKASDPQLRQGLEDHVAQSEEQRERVQEALEKLGARPGRKVCEAMRGLVEAAQHEMEEQDKGPILGRLADAGLAQPPLALATCWSAGLRQVTVDSGLGWSQSGVGGHHDFGR